MKNVRNGCDCGDELLQGVNNTQKRIKYISKNIIGFFYSKWRDFFVNIIASFPLTPNWLRLFILRRFGCKIGKSIIFPRCFFGGKNIIIGNGVFINYNCFLDNSGKIEIGDNTHLGMDVLLCTSTHEIGSCNMRAGNGYGKDIKIGKGCWLGARTIILPGVTIGDGCVIAANATVTKDIPANSLAAGVPAKIIKTLE